MSVKIKLKGAARRRRPAGPSATGEHHFGVLSYTKKIIFIFFGLVASAAKQKVLGYKILSHYKHLLLVLEIAAIINSMKTTRKEVQSTDNVRLTRLAL